MALEHGPALTNEGVRRLREIVVAARAARDLGDTAVVAQGNQEFHRAIARLGGSRRLDHLMEGALAEMRLVFHQMDAEQDFHALYLDRNDEIVHLLERGDRGGSGPARLPRRREEHLTAALGASTRPS